MAGSYIAKEISQKQGGKKKSQEAFLKCRDKIDNSVHDHWIPKIIGIPGDKMMSGEENTILKVYKKQ